MHGAGLWLGVFGTHMRCGTAVTSRMRRFDADILFDLVARERIESITIVGDAFGKPMLQALRNARDSGRPFDLSSLQQVLSSGVMLSREVKEGLLEFADISILDAMGSSEGTMGSSVVSRANPPGDTAQFVKNPNPISVNIVPATNKW